MGFGEWKFFGGKRLLDELYKEPIIPLPMDFVLDNITFYKPPTSVTISGVTDISQAGIDFIKREEGYESTAYQDSVGVWTIGYGTIRINARPVRRGDTCTKKQAEEWLLDEINHLCVPWVRKLVTVPLTQEMFDTLCSFIYNLGWPAFSRSTLLKMLNAGNYRGAADQLLRWNKGKVDGKYVEIDGLTNRRKRERENFIVGISNLNLNVG